MLVVWVLGCGAPMLQVFDIPSLHPAKIGQDKNRVVGRDTGIDVWDLFCQGHQRLNSTQLKTNIERQSRATENQIINV